MQLYEIILKPLSETGKQSTESLTTLPKTADHSVSQNWGWLQETNPNLKRKPNTFNPVTHAL